MTRLLRLAAGLAVVVPVLSGCGGGDGGGGGGGRESGSGDRARPPPPRPKPASGVWLAMRHTEPLRSGAPVTWTLEVRNGGPGPAALTFSSAQRGDVVLSRGGEERYRWSRGRAFAQVLGTLDLAPGQSQAFDLSEDRLGAEPGTYELVAELASDPAPAEVRRPVTVVPT